MSYSFAKRTYTRKRPGSQHGREEERRKKPALPNSMVMRIMEEDAAEREADLLSKGITSTTPDALRQEMGSRLGADFSNVRFHDDRDSRKKSRSLGARAWTKGSEVYFGRGGFDPSVGAHELVHTVQQGAVQGNVSQSMPLGAVQLLPGDDPNQIRQNIPANATNQELMIDQYTSGQYGRTLFETLKSSVKQLAEKSGSHMTNGFTAQNGLSYMAALGETDYSGKEILRDIAVKTVINKDEQYELEDEYGGFLDYMEKRANKSSLEFPAYQLGLLRGDPKYNHDREAQSHKRAYELTAQELARPGFNPTKDSDVNDAQAKIDAATTAQDAFYAFLEYTNSTTYSREKRELSQEYVNFSRRAVPRYEPKDKKKKNPIYDNAEVHVGRLKAKLKNMVRQVRDYPELRKTIGALNIMWSEADAQGKNWRGDITNDAVMSVRTSPGASKAATINYDAYLDFDDPVAQERRRRMEQSLANSIGSPDNIGNHELGHVLESTLNTEEDQQIRGDASNDILQSVLQKVMNQQEQNQVNYNQQNGKNSYDKPIFQGHIDTSSPIFTTKQMTSRYGQSSPKEWFAEAFHDVYTKGADAKPTSIEIVKEYERRQTAKQKAGFKKREAGILTKIGRFFSRFVNFGRRHGDPEPAAQNAGANPVEALLLQNGANDNPDLLDEPMQNNEEDKLNESMIVHKPNWKKIKKKRKKK